MVAPWISTFSIPTHFSAIGLAESSTLKPDFSLRSSFLISNKGDVSSIFINVNRKFVLE